MSRLGPRGGLRGARRLFLLAVVTAVLSGCAVFPRSSRTGDEPFSFAFVSDTHIFTTDPSGPKAEHTARMREALRQLGERKDIDFILHGGDTIEQPGSVEQFSAFEALMTPAVPWYPIAGNHDIGNSPDRAKIDLWIQRGYGRGPHNREFYGFVHKSAAFYILDTFADLSGDAEVRQRAEDQLEEMDRFFAAQESVPHKVVCGHAPLFIRSAEEPDEYFNIPSRYRSRILEILARHGVTTYLSGHRHQQDFVQDPSGVSVYTQTSLAFFVGPPMPLGYSIFTVSKSGLSREFFPVEIERP